MHKELKKLKENIEKSRLELIFIIEKAGPDCLINEDILRISNELDKLINRYNTYLRKR